MSDRRSSRLPDAPHREQHPWVTTLNSPLKRPDLILDLPDLDQVDVIGDLHGCLSELTSLLQLLGHDRILDARYRPDTPDLIFVGDLVDRGDRNLETLLVIIDLVERGAAKCVLGNHDYRFARWLKDDHVAVTHGLDVTVEEFLRFPEEEQQELREKVLRFYDTLPSVVRFDKGRGVVVHAAWRPTMKVEEDPKRIFYYAMYGPTTGETTDEGYPVRYNWSPVYRGPEHAIFGHQVYPKPNEQPFATGIDTGCVFGGALTALRWPSRELISVPSTYARAEHRALQQSD